MQETFIRVFDLSQAKYSITIKCSKCNQFYTFYYKANPKNYPKNASALIVSALKECCPNPSCQHKYMPENLESISIDDQIGDKQCRAFIKRSNPNGFSLLFSNDNTFCSSSNLMTKKIKKNFSTDVEINKIHMLHDVTDKICKCYFSNEIEKKKYASYYEGHIKHKNCQCNTWKRLGSDNGFVELKCCLCGETENVSDELLKEKFYPRQNDSKIQRHLYPADVIVLSTDKRCTLSGHETTDVKGTVLVFNHSGGQSVKSVMLSYCSTCARFVMRTSDFISLNGYPNCTVRDLRTNKTIYKPDIQSELSVNLSPQSILSKNGYTVKSGSGIPISERQRILVRVIENGIMTRNQVCDHLQYLIYLNDGKKNYESAVSKWRSDLDYIQSYKFKTDREVLISSMTLKGLK